MIKHSVPVGTGSAATTSLNLSETQHCFFNYTNAYDAEGMLTGDKSTPSDGCLDQGGNGEMSAYTFQRWCGAASESVSALAYSRASTVASSGLDSQYAYGSNICHVQNSEWIPASNIDAVKQAIMDYGAGNISYYETGSAYTYICTIDNSSQSSSSHKWANHAITLVGWDDSIATSNFKPNTPSSKGAWICKNSWGTSYFNQGYCYISYQDTSVLEGYIYFYDAEPIDNYAHNYQYDGSCNVVNFGKGWNSSIDTCTGFANNTKVANVFTAKGSESLEAIAFCNWDEALTCTVQVYKNPTTPSP
jgi:C1A family cysteine protease